MSEVATARHLFERFQDCAVRQDWLAFGDLFAEDGTMEFPFVSPGAASRYEGREAIRAKARQAWGSSPLRAEEFCSVVAEEGADPGVLFAEYELCGTVAASKEPFRIPAAIVLRARAGLIVSMREYLDPLALVKATGRAEALAANLLRDLGVAMTPPASGAPGDVEASLALVRRYFEMWNTGNWAEADAVLGPTYLDHAHPGVIGPAAVRSLVRRFRSENPRARVETEIIAFDAEYVVVRRATRWTARGETEQSGISLFRVADAQLVEQWSWSPAGQHAPPPGPREIRERAHRRLRTYDVDGFAGMFAPNGPLEQPGVQRRLGVRGEIRRLLTPTRHAARGAGRRITGYDPVVVHPTEDPEVIVVEIDLHGEDAAGEAYRLPYVQIVSARDGRVVVLRDYFDSFAIGEEDSADRAATPEPLLARR